ncbi:hypothetical protein BWQ96_01738 [Gracilariopsis chorda]|uniref:Uncharacterized protein n=1 Tax=Gracilariopsis chorda TaxID=448386 RepID=A0A2V3J2G4_9FLOR|nr:hypothetical protein BWQ96_01738 [Gracilariopsis chorda]|eukprot:PXF48569.1 hypothetical protein BWQ96_01738 [Gracilariopsis chorda]
MTHRVGNNNRSRANPQWRAEANRPWETLQGAAKDPHESVLMELAHEILDFNIRVQTIIQPCASLENPESLARFVKSVAKNSSALSAARDVALGSFATFAVFITMLCSTDPKLCATDQNPSSAATDKAALQNLKVKPTPQTASTARIVSVTPKENNSRLPKRNTTNKTTRQTRKENPKPQTASTPKIPSIVSKGSSSLPSKRQLRPSEVSEIVKTSSTSDSIKDLDTEPYSVSKKELQHMHRRSIRACGYEEKGFALITTDPCLPAIRSANFLGSLFSKGGIKDPLTIFETPETHQFLAFGPLVCLPKLQRAYESSRMRLVRKRGFLNLPRLSVKPLNDLMEVCADNVTKIDLLQLVKCLRGEIDRLEAQELRWSPRKYFSEALRIHEKKCYEILQSSCSGYILDPTSNPSGICAIE